MNIRQTSPKISHKPTVSNALNEVQMKLQLGYWHRSTSDCDRPLPHSPLKIFSVVHGRTMDISVAKLTCYKWRMRFVLEDEHVNFRCQISFWTQRKFALKTLKVI